eukprot:scaffold106192_cov68-Phaeocystis_antarctica.AAC.1
MNAGAPRAPLAYDPASWKLATYSRLPPLVITPETVQAGHVDPLSKTTPSSPASSPPLCIPWAKARPRPQAGPPDTLAGRQLLSPTCHTAVAALLNGAGEREVKKLNLLTLPVFWCLGDGPTMHEEGSLPGTPGRRVRALPMTDPLVTRPRANAQPQRPRPQ